MKSISTLFRQLFLIVAILFTFSLSAWGEEVTATLTFDNTNKRTSFSTSKQVWEQNGITFTNDKSSSTSNVANYVAPVRLYASSKITIEAPGNITEIVFDCNSGSYATALKNSIGTVSGATVSVSSDKVTVTFTSSVESFTVAKLTAQVRMDALTVTYVAPTIPTLKVEPISINFGDIEQNEMVGDQVFTLTGSNLTNEITLELSNTTDFSISKSAIPIDDANSTQLINVTLNSTENIGVKEGKITISSKGVESQIIDLYANVITPKQRFNINFYHNGEIRHTLQIAEGESIGTFPSIDGLVSCNPNLPVFVGWISDFRDYVNVENENAPNFFDSTTPINQNIDLYAVFADASMSQTWYHVKNTSDLTDGSKVLIVYPTKNVAAGMQNGTYRNSTPVSLSNNQIIDIKEAKIFTLGVTSSGYTFYSDDEKHYLSYEGSGNALNTVANITSTSAYWNISISNDITKIFNSKTATFEIQYNASSPRFACYKSTQQPIALYKPSFNEPTKWTICSPKDEVIPSGNTITVNQTTKYNTLTIKSNGDQAGQINVTNGSISANKVILEKTIDDSRWFFFSLPFDCDLKYVVATDADDNVLTYAYDEKNGDYVINYYDQTRNATTNKAWVELIGRNHTLKANQGYIIGHFGTGDVTVKFPSKDAVTISVPATKTLNYTDSWTAGDVENSTNGWNLIGMPYYQKPNNSSLSADINVYFATIPNDDGKTYTQTTFADADIAPFTSFFVQTTEAPTFTIAAQQNAAPMLRAKGEVSKAVIALADANGMDDKTTIINNPNNTNEYEIGHDLAKWIGYAERPQIYSIQGDDILAFNSLAIDNSTVIPLGVYAHADGDYTFALSEKSIGDLEGWELYDNETGSTTRLAYEDLTIYLEQGTHEGRFEIRLQQRVPTVCDNTMGDMMTWTANGTLNISNMPADAVVYIYDAVGRMVHVATPNTNTFNYDFVARGVYNIVVRTADNTVSFKTIY